MLRKYIPYTVCLSALIFLSISAFSIRPVHAQGGDLSGVLDLFVENGANPLSDIVTGGLSIANRKVYREAFAELRRERSFYDFDPQTDDRASSGSLRGQSDCSSHTFWFNPMGRGGEYASVLPVDDYELQSYGFQGGTTFLSSKKQSLGIMAGYERGKLRNSYNLNSLVEPYLHWIEPYFPKGYELPEFRNEANSTRFDDIYLGLYYGRMFRYDIEFRGYIGGGHQRYKTSRNDQKHGYVSDYEGASFEMNLEIARYHTIWRGIKLRPFIALDIEHVQQESGQENVAGSLFRFYDRSTLSQMFCRLGADLEKRWSRVDLHGGLSYTFLVLGKRRAEAPIFYPGFMDGVGFQMPGARLGRSSWNLRAGLNFYLNAARTNMLFIDYVADIHTDRANDTALHTAAVGFSLRF